MAGRIRCVKPEWLDDERLIDCSDAARTLSIALLLLADDKGRSRLGKVVAARVFPTDPSKFDSALAELSPWYVRRYEVRGQRYYAVTNWFKHQRIDRPSKPLTPEPTEGRWLDAEAESSEHIADSRDTSEDSASTRELLATDLDQGSGSGPGGDQREDAPPAPKLKVFRTDAAGTRAIDPLRASFAAPSSIEIHAFQAWAAAFGKTGTTYDSRRAACLAERVGAGMSAQDADDAIAGALADDYVNGRKSDGKKHDRLIFIFGDAERYEEFRDAGRALRERPSGTLRKVPSIAERQAADARAEAERRAAKGLPALKEAAPVDAAELDRLIAQVGRIG